MPYRWLCLALCLTACGDDDDGGADDVPGFPDSSLPDDRVDAAAGPLDAAPDQPDAALALDGAVDAVDAAPGQPDAAPGQPDAGTTTGDVAGCTPDAKFLPVPEDPSAAGPWPVGARTVKIGRLSVEVFYPAVPGSEVGKDTARYDLRLWLPASEQSKIPDADNPWQDCDCVKDLPLDGAHGKYPLVVFIHGTAGFRTQSLVAATHWASRGFVVVAADHPGLFLGDLLALACFQAQSGPRTIPADVDAVLAALTTATGGLSFLAGKLDLTRVAVAGHSAGGAEAANLSGRPGVRVVIPMAGNPAVKDSPTLESVLWMAANKDMVVTYATSKTGYNGSPSPKRWVGVDNSGHLAFSDLCELKNAAGQNLLEIATAKNVCGVFLAGGLFDCEPTYTPAPQVNGIVKFASTAVLEDTLKCSAGSAAKIDGIAAAYAAVAEVLKSL